MPPHLAWLDHDTAARQRSLKILSQFNERSTRDELGLGAIRDPLADALFPGTSTIQTRLRYMLFVPWIYRDLERRNRPPDRFAKLAEDQERALINPLCDSADPAGVFGREAGTRLQRLPSSVYWFGLGAWGIRCYPGSQQDYLRTGGKVRLVPLTEDAEEGTTQAGNWHPHLPEPPADFPDRADFALTRPEAEFLQGRIVESRPDSLLAFLARERVDVGMDFPWQLDLAYLSADHRRLLHHAHRFSLVMHGAAIVYNLALTRLEGERLEAIRQAHQTRLEDWRTRLDEIALADWSLTNFWQLLADLDARISPPTRQFVEDWTAEIRAACHRPLPDGGRLYSLVENRERKLKGARSRFTNQRNREQWQGYAGMSQFTFRWETARSLLTDLYDGLDRP